jgi:hypothetical protein
LTMAHDGVKQKDCGPKPAWKLRVAYYLLCRC